MLCGFRKGYSAQRALLRLIEGLKKCMDKKDVAGEVLMDLSKAFDYLPHISQGAMGIDTGNFCGQFNIRFKTYLVPY